jgi:DNA-binding MarR family transcriptional regulator
MAIEGELSDDDYWRLLEFRTAIRKFIQYSRTQAANVGLTATQHQLLLAIRGHRGERAPTVGDVARWLLIRPHSAVELIDRAQKAGLVQRTQDPNDQRVIRMSLTKSGAEKLDRISKANLAELGRLGPEFLDVWQAIQHLGS